MNYFILITYNILALIKEVYNIMVRILSKKSFYFVGRFSDLIYILNNISDKKVTLKEFLAGEIN